MKTCLSLFLTQLCFAASLWSQTPAPKSPVDSSADYVVTTGVFPHPGLVAYKVGMKISEAISSARGGDYTEFGDVRTVYLIRCGKKEKVDLKVLRSNPSKEPVLQPWDIVYLPPVLW